MSYVKILRIPKFLGRVNRHCYWLIKDSVTGKNLAKKESMSEAIYLVEQEGWVLESNV